MGTQQRRLQIKWWQWMSVDWYTNLHAVANGGHGFSLKLENLNPVNKWSLVLRSVTFNDDLHKLINIFVGNVYEQKSSPFWVMSRPMRSKQNNLHEPCQPMKGLEKCQDITITIRQSRWHHGSSCTSYSAFKIFFSSPNLFLRSATEVYVLSTLARYINYSLQ